MLGGDPKVTIGIPVYNGEAFLAQAIESILAQTLGDFRLIVSDNASTDSTRAICADFERLDRRFRYFRKDRNIGASENYNQLFRASSGQYFKWAADDDLLEPDFLKRCVQTLDADPSAVLACPETTFVDAADMPIEVEDKGSDLSMESAADRMAFVVQWGHWCNAMFALMRRDALAKTRLIGHYPGGDYRLLGELALLGKFQVVPERLFRRRLHDNSSSQNTHREWQLAFYTPDRPRRLCVPTVWRQMDHLRAVFGAELRLGEKLQLTKLIGRQLRWGRHDILRECRAVSGELLRPPRNTTQKRRAGVGREGHA